jgi:hypothetical protein
MILNVSGWWEKKSRILRKAKAINFIQSTRINYSYEKELPFS